MAIFPAQATVDEAQLAYLRFLAQEDTAEQQWVRTLRDYAAGDHPVYLTDRQEEYLGLWARDTDHLWYDNVCAKVLREVRRRLIVSGFRSDVTDGDSLAAEAWNWWQANDFDGEMRSLFHAALRDGAAYIIVSWDGERPVWAINEKFDGTQGVKFHRDPDTGKPLFASKRWKTFDPVKPNETGKSRLTLYFPDRVEKYLASTSPANEAGWDPILDAKDEPWPIPWVDERGEPLGVAVIPFDNPDGSELNDIVPLQDALNKSDLDLLASQDGAGFPVRWGTGVTLPRDPDTGDETEVLMSPGRFLHAPSPDARFGQLEAAAIDPQVAGCLYWLQRIASNSDIPLHTLHASGQIPRAETIRELYSGLRAHVEEKQSTWGNSFVGVVMLSARLDNLYRRAGWPTSVHLETVWRDAFPRDEREAMERGKVQQEIGFPFRQILRELGYSQEQVDEIVGQRGTEQTALIAQVASAISTNGRGG